MARSRNIKPGFFQHEDLGELTPLERLAFIGMWTICDFKGCFELKLKRLKVQLLPYDDCDMGEIVINLEQAGFIRSYAVLGRSYIKILNFQKHQNPHKNEVKSGSDIPDLEENGAELGSKDEKPDKIGSEPDKIGTAPADSLLLIPDSLKPLTDSLKKTNKENSLPDAAPVERLPVVSLVPERREALARCISCLNEATSHGYREAPHLVSRLKLAKNLADIAQTEAEACLIVRCKTAEWAGTEFEKHLAPITLWAPKHWDKYRAQAEKWQKSGCPPRINPNSGASIAAGALHILRSEGLGA